MLEARRRCGISNNIDENLAHHAQYPFLFGMFLGGHEIVAMVYLVLYIIIKDNRSQKKHMDNRAQLLSSNGFSGV